MSTSTKRKTSLTLDANARREKWLLENAEAFSAQATWLESHDHPLADIMIGPMVDVLMVGA